MKTPDESALQEGEELVSLALLDGYKVRWSRETVARDVVQNFFDEVDDFDAVTVAVDDKARSVRVEGPSVFAMEYLRYVGATTKADPARRTAGGFGEGFKVCALVLLRDFKATLQAASGRWMLRVFLRPVKLGRELCYAVRRVEEAEARAGSVVEIGRCDPALREAFRGSKDLFKHPKNPLLARPLHVDAERGVGVWYATTPALAEVFYRKQLRGRLRFSKGRGLTIALDDRVEALEGDRDRRDLRQLAAVVREVVKRLPDESLKAIVAWLRPYWTTGNTFLAAALREAGRRGVTMEFPPRWLAREARSYLEQHAGRMGFKVAMAPFAGVGMTTVTERFGGRHDHRAPTTVERLRIDVARGLYQRILKEPPQCEPLRVADAPDARPRRLYSNDGAQVPARALSGPFNEGVMACLHALSLGDYRSSSNDADRLTEILEGLLRWPEVAREAEAAWARCPDVAANLAEPEAPTEPEFEEHFPTSDPRSVLIEVATVPGVPALAALAARLEATAKELGLRPIVHAFCVRSEEEAWSEGAPGVPTVWIAGHEVAPARRRPAYVARRYEGDAIVPGDDLLRAALLDVAKVRAAKAVGPRGPRRRARSRDAPVLADFDRMHRRRARATEQWRRAHDHPAWFSARAHAHTGSARSSLRTLVSRMDYAPSSFESTAMCRTAERMFAAMSPAARADVMRWDDARFEALMTETYASLDDGIEALSRRIAAALSQCRDDVREMIAGWCLGRVEKAPWKTPADWLAHPIVERLEDAAAVCAEVIAAPVGEETQRYIAHDALAALAASRRRPPALAVERARAEIERLLRAAETAAMRMERKGLNPDDAAVVAALRDGRKRAEKDAPAPPDPVAAAVGEAWDASVALGKTQLEALTECLAVAERAEKRRRRR